MAKNTGQGRRIGAVRSRSEFKVGKTWYKRDATTGRILCQALALTGGRCQ